MPNLFQLTRTGVRGFGARLQQHGWQAALMWLGGQGLPRLTGVPLARFSRITPDIYVGPQISRAGKTQLEAWGITGSVNLRAEYDDAAHHLALPHYCYLPTIDRQAPTLAQVEQGLAFIQTVLAKGGKVYIHCESGVGRAPTLAAAYFIRQGLNRAAAIALIARARPFIDLTEAQRALLHRVETQSAASRPDHDAPPPVGLNQRGG